MRNKKFYITFGQVHAHAAGGNTYDKDSVCMIRAETENIAREIAFKAFGSKWAFIHKHLPKMEYYPRGVIELKQ